MSLFKRSLGVCNVAARFRQSFPHATTAGMIGVIAPLPDSLRFLLILACLVAVAYGTAWGLANFPPEQTEIVKSLPHEKLRQE